MIEIRDRAGNDVTSKRWSATWELDIHGVKSWTGLDCGDHVYIDGSLAFVAEYPAWWMMAASA